MLRWLWIALLFVNLNAEQGDFEVLMGKGTPAWSALKTREDWDRLTFFKDCFEKTEAREGRIPEVLHFIWLGPKPFPEESMKHVSRWIEMHPGWFFKFWTDKERMLPDPRMELVIVDQLPYLELEELYYKADNYAERAAVLCSAILIAEGGVYLDHDVRCVKPLYTLQKGYDFFCGLEPLEGSLLSSSVNVGTHVVGAVPGHPVLVHTIDWLLKNWKRVEEQYPGKTSGDILYRMQHRVGSALNRGVELGLNSEGFNSIVFPSYYFNGSAEQQAVYTVHAHEMSWKKNEPDQKLFESFSGVQSQLSAAFLWACGLGALNVILGILVIRRMLVIR